MKTALKIILPLVILGLAYIVYDQIMQPQRFDNERKVRESAVIQKLKDIRSAQRSFKQTYQRFTGSLDTLIDFILYDSLVFEQAIGSMDDSTAIALGQVKREKFKVAAIDTVFVNRKLTVEEVKNLRYIPYTNNEEFRMEAGSLTTESQVVVPVFEARAPFKDFLNGMDPQLIVNLNDDRERYDKYKGLKVGSMTESTNEAGNWE